MLHSIGIPDQTLVYHPQFKPFPSAVSTISNSISSIDNGCPYVNTIPRSMNGLSTVPNPAAVVALATAAANATNGIPPNIKDSRWLTLEVCRQFQRNQCSRDENECKFAHPPTHVDVQSGRVVCCYDSIKGKCQRRDPPCKYLHPPQHLREQLIQNGKNNMIMRNVQFQLLQQQLLAQTTNVVPLAAAAAAAAVAVNGSKSNSNQPPNSLLYATPTPTALAISNQNGLPQVPPPPPPPPPPSFHFLNMGFSPFFNTMTTTTGLPNLHGTSTMGGHLSNDHRQLLNSDQINKRNEQNKMDHTNYHNHHHHNHKHNHRTINSLVSTKLDQVESTTISSNNTNNNNSSTGNNNNNETSKQKESNGSGTSSTATNTTTTTTTTTNNNNNNNMSNLQLNSITSTIPNTNHNHINTSTVAIPTTNNNNNNNNAATVAAVAAATFLSLQQQQQQQQQQQHNLSLAHPTPLPLSAASLVAASLAAAAATNGMIGPHSALANHFPITLTEHAGYFPAPYHIEIPPFTYQ